MNDNYHAQLDDFLLDAFIPVMHANNILKKIALMNIVETPRGDGLFDISMMITPVADIKPIEGFIATKARLRFEIVFNGCTRNVATGEYQWDGLDYTLKHGHLSNYHFSNVLWGEVRGIGNNDSNHASWVTWRNAREMGITDAIDASCASLLVTRLFGQADKSAINDFLSALFQYRNSHAESVAIKPCEQKISEAA